MNSGKSLCELQHDLVNLWPAWPPPIGMQHLSEVGRVEGEHQHVVCLHSQQVKA